MELPSIFPPLPILGALCTEVGTGGWILSPSFLRAGKKKDKTIEVMLVSDSSTRSKILNKNYEREEDKKSTFQTLGTNLDSAED